MTAGIQTTQDSTEAMRSQEERLRLLALVDSAGEALVSSTLDGTITSWNAGAEQLFGYTTAEAVGRSLRMLLPADPTDRLARSLEIVARSERISARETDRVRRDGTAVQVSMSVAPLRNAHGTLSGAIWSFHDIGALKRTEAELAHRASHDALTGLPNRFLFQDRLDQAIRAAQRSDRPLGVLVLDIDRFEDINDAFGHGLGDGVLSEVSARLLEQARSVDTVARIDGDKFAVLTPDTGADAVLVVASRLRAALQRPIPLAGKEVSLDVVFGIALHPHHGADATTLLRRAEMAKTVAKQTATGMSVFRTELDRASRDRATLVAELRRAIERGELVVHFQPVVDLASRLILGVEALVRWDHPTRGLLPPDRFVPLAEQSSLMGELTRYVLTRSLQCYRRWHERGRAVPVLVNVSPRDLRDPSFVPTIKALHDAYRVSPKWLELEITEGFVVEDLERVIATIQRIRELGVLVALDDFGTGYSSLSYLARLPVDAVKIDRSFIGAMRSDKRNDAIVRATVGLAHTLGVATVAEGIEDDETLALVKEVGCDMAQGYRIARPMSASELDRWLTTAAWRPRPAPIETGVRAWRPAPVPAAGHSMVAA